MTENRSHSIARGGWRLFFSTATVLLASARIWKPNKIDNTVILLSLIAMGPWLLPFLLRHLRSIEAFGGKIEFLEEKVEHESRRVDELYFLSIGEKLAEHLRKLTQPEGYREFFVGSALPRELEFLENLGYIKFKPPLQGLDDFLAKFDNRPGENLSDYVALTDNGKLFIEQFKKSKAKRSIETMS